MADGFELLVEAHRKIAQLFERYAAEADDALVRQTVEELTVHGAMEEEALYPQLRRLVDDGNDLADEAEAEHAAVRTLIARIELSPPENLRPLVDDLRTMVEQHVRAEESSLFPSMREAGVDSEDLGHRLAAARTAVLSRRAANAANQANIENIETVDELLDEAGANTGIAAGSRVTHPGTAPNDSPSR